MTFRTIPSSVRNRGTRARLAKDTMLHGCKKLTRSSVPGIRSETESTLGVRSGANHQWEMSADSSSGTRLSESMYSWISSAVHSSMSTEMNAFVLPRRARTREIRSATISGSSTQGRAASRVRMSWHPRQSAMSASLLGSFCFPRT